MKRIIYTALLVSLIGSSVALADPSNRRDERQGHGQAQISRHEGNRDGRYGFEGQRYEARRFEERRGEGYRVGYGGYGYRYGYAPRGWARGEFLPGPYAPPYGYHWIHVDGDLVLAAITTGLVLDIAHGFFR
jgi:Ni/Co efflux regulator RcnB